MDFILKQLNSKIAIEDVESNRYFNLQRQRIDYVLLYALAYVWDKNAANIDILKYSDLLENLNRMSVGNLIQTIRQLDEEGEVFSNKKARINLNDYPTFRNENHGHGYVLGDKEKEIVNKLEEFYSIFTSEIPIFSDNTDLIFVKKHENNIVSGLRFATEDNGLPQRWSCHEQLFKYEGPIIGRCFALTSNDEYIKLSPFIHLENDGDDRFIFISLEEKLTGKIKYSQLLRTNNNYYKEWEELTNIFVVQNKHRVISSNGTIMNEFENNYREYIDINMEIAGALRKFLLEEKSNVSCTIWGHGGVGKTALIQNIASELFNGDKKKFDYIIFASAKDRKYNPITGQIEDILDNIRSFEEVIFTISATLFDLDMDYEDFKLEIEHYIDLIINSNSVSLFIIDDFETFSDKEKEKIFVFIDKLHINHHKVVITTRVKSRIIGKEIPTAEFNKKTSKEFLLKIIEAEYSSNLKQIEMVIKDEKKMNQIYLATSGRPIFLYQFAHLFVQKGFKDEHFDKLANSKNAQSFLYDRLYDYLSDGARNLFIYISQIVSNEDLSFNYTILEYMVSHIENRIIRAEELEELIFMKILVSDTEKVFRVYSDEILKLMKDYFIKRDEKFRDTVHQVINNIGETDFEGDIYEILLNKINRNRRFETEEVIIRQYREFLDNPNCKLEIKLTAIKNVTGHFETLNKPEISIQFFTKYYHLIKGNQELIRLYVRLLWNNKNIENDLGTEACNILSEYYESRKLFERESLALFFIWVEYQGKLCLQRRREDIESANGDEEEILKIRLAHKVKLVNYINQLGFRLYEFTTTKSMDEILEVSLYKNHLTNAVVQVVKAGTEIIILDDDNINRLEMILNLIKYGISNLQPRSHEVLKGCLGTIEKMKNLGLNDILLDLKESDFDKFKRKYKLGDVVYFNITGIVDYGVFGEVNKCRGLVHKNKIPKQYQVESLSTHFNKGSQIKIEIINIDDNNNRFGGRFIDFAEV